MSTESTENKNKPSYTKRLVENLKKECKSSDNLNSIIKKIESYALEEAMRIDEINKENAGKLTFGRYKGKLLVDVAKLDETYVKWLKKSTQYLNSDLKEILKTL